MYSGDGERTVENASSRVPAPFHAAQDSHSLEKHKATCDLCDSRITGARYVSGFLDNFDDMSLMNVHRTSEMLELSWYAPPSLACFIY